MIALGVDPGSQTTGYGIIRAENGELKCLSAGFIETDTKLSMAERLCEIGTQLAEIIAEFKPTAVSVEKVFFAKNADSALKLGQARGVILYESARAGVAVFEYNPTEVKKSLTGNGRAEKEQVQFIIKATLGLGVISRLDVSDALALALHHSRVSETQESFNRGAALARAPRKIKQEKEL